jgi:hypothetical protein
MPDARYAMPEQKVPPRMDFEPELCFNPAIQAPAALPFQFFDNEFVQQGRVGLAFGGLHDLAYKEAG